MMQKAESLRLIPMLANLPPWQLEAVAEAVEPLEFEKGSQLLESGTDDGYTYFLSEGELRFDAADGECKRVAASKESVRSPVANLRPRLFGVSAESFVRVFRVPDLVLSAAGCSGEIPATSDILVEDAVPERRQNSDSRLSFDLYQDLRNDRAALPSLPDLAFRIRKAIDEDGSDARTIAHLVESDPAMAAKLLKAANSAIYGGMGSVGTVSSAVVRLGMRTTRQLVMTFAMKEVFKCDDPMILERMQRLWKHSANVAALCFVLAREVNGIDPEEALLIGLVHDVGVISILGYSGKYPELTGDEEKLEQTISRIRGELGAMILRKWALSPKVVAGARDAENWGRDHPGAADTTDLLIVAQVHERLRKHQLEGMPSLDEIPALKRVLGDDVSPEKSLAILHEAKDRIDEMRNVLRT